MNHCFIIRSPHGDSRICMEEDGFCKLHEYIHENHVEAKVAIITDGNVEPIFKERIKNCLPKARVIVVKPGEASKSMQVAEDLCKDLLKHGFNRNTVIIGLGGGMITDLAGFVASVYMRGVPYIAMPTTLLSMIDASVGGKTGVNLGASSGAKNIIGTFYPAEIILIDLDFLKTLPERQMKIGVAEVIKYTAVLDSSLKEVLMKEKVDYIKILEKGLRCKATVCNKDLKEAGLRKVLNFGHTLGHAVEHLSKYKLSHGEAISIGMTLANKIAQKLGKQTKKQGDEIAAMFAKYDLPTELPDYIKKKEMIDMVYRDKKMDGQEVTFILSKGLGKHEFVKLTPEKLSKLLG